MTDLVEVPLMPATHAQLAEIISLRDYFAMTTLPALIGAAAEMTKKIPLHPKDIQSFSEYAYLYADAMLREKARTDKKHEVKT